MSSNTSSKDSFPAPKSLFISSTFIDMQKERDILNLHVLPEVNEFARQYGSSVESAELRWGVRLTTECVDIIEMCNHYMIVLLGDRYGISADKKLIDYTSTKGMTCPLVYDEANPMSITELEIRFGALDKPEYLKRCLFYFREQLPVDRMSEEQKKRYAAENDDCKRKMDNLKAAIRGKGGKVSEYHADWDETDEVTGLDKFREQVINDIKQLLLDEWDDVPKNLTWQDSERISDNIFINEKCSHFIGRAKAVSDCKNFADSDDKKLADSDDKKLLIMRGNSGSGKSSMICRLVREFEDETHTPVSVFCGNSPYAATSWQVLQSLVYRFEELLDISDHFGLDEEKSTLSKDRDDKKSLSLEDWRNKLSELIGQYIYTTHKHPVILIDALDQLLDSETAGKLTFLPDFLPDGASVIISCLSDYQIKESSPLMKNAINWSLPDFSDADVREAIHSILSVKGKELDSRVIDKLVEMAKHQTILYISFALQWLIMFDEDDFTRLHQFKKEKGIAGHDEALCQYMIDVLSKLPENLEEMCVSLIKETGERVNSVLVKTAADLLSVSRYGLRMSDLEAVFTAHNLEWNEEDLRRLMRYLSSYFMTLADGRINFTHRSIREGLKNSIQNPNEYQQWIFEHLKRLDPDDPVKVSEMVYHTYLADDKKYLIQYLSEMNDVKNEKEKKITASAVRDLCLSGSEPNKWVASTAFSAGNDYIPGCVSFILDDIYERFEKSMDELPVLLNVISRLQNGLEAVLPDKRTAEHRRDLSISLNEVGDIVKIQGRLDDALSKYQESLNIAEQLAKELKKPEYLRDLSVSLEKIGDLFTMQDRLDDALSNYQDSLNIREQLAKELKTPGSLRNHFISLIKVGDLFTMQSKFDDALSKYQDSLNIREQLINELKTPESQHDLSVILERIGIIFEKQGKLDDALSKYQEALNIVEQLANELETPESQRNLTECLMNVGDIFKKKGNLFVALSNYQKALNIREQLANELKTPESLRDLSISLNKVGDIFKEQGKLDDSFSKYQESLNIRKQLTKKLKTPESLRDLSISLINVGLIFEAQGSLAAALSKYQESLDIFELLANKLKRSVSLRDLSFSLNKIGDMFRIQGKLDDALSKYLEALNIRKQLLSDLKTPDSQRDISVNLNKVGDVFTKQGKYDAALSKYQDSLKITEQLATKLKTPPAQHDLMISLCKIGTVLEAQEQNSAALENYQRAFGIAETIKNKLHTEEFRNDYNDVVERIANLQNKRLSRIIPRQNYHSRIKNLFNALQSRFKAKTRE